MDPVIKTISKEIEIHCKRCDYKGMVTATRVYYIDCPECDKPVYVKYLTLDD